MSNNNEMKVYQFLSNYGSNWKNEMDGCVNGKKDGIIIKAEFTKFLYDNWDGEEMNLTLTNDIISDFWKKFDTCTSGKVGKLWEEYALNKNEQAALDKKLENFIAVNEYVEGLSVPAGVDAKEWKTSVKTSITEHLEEYTGKYNGEDESIQDFVKRIGAIAQAKTTANCLAKAYLKEQIEEYKDLVGDYDFSADIWSKEANSLGAKLTAYINNLEDVTAENLSDKLDEIKAAVEELVNEYLADAGIPDDTNINDTKDLSPLQKAIAQQSIIENLEDLRNSDEYKNYQKEFDEAVLAFIEESQGLTFCELKSLDETDFEVSDAKKTLDDVLYVRTNYVNLSDAFYDRLVSKYGQELADKIKNDNKYIQAYKDIINEVIEKVKAGELEATKAGDYILEAIDKHLLEFYGNNTSNLSLEQLKKIYDTQMSAAIEKGNNATTDEEYDEALSDQRNAAKFYCDALAKRGEIYKNALKEIFGGDYNTVIATLLPSEIQKLMAEVIEKVEELGDANNMKLADSTWANIPDTIAVLKGGQNTSLSMNPEILIDGSSFEIKDTNRITYKSSNESLISIAKDGSMTIKSPSSSSATVTISVYVDGVEVGKKTITVKQAEQMNLGTVDRKLNGKPINELLVSTNNSLSLSSFRSGRNESAQAAISGLKTWVNNLVTALKGTGKYDEAQLSLAAKRMELYYTAMINAISQNFYAGSTSALNATRQIEFTYLDESGNTKTETNSYFNNTYSDESDVRGRMNACTTGTGICVNVSYQNTDTFEWNINTAVLLKKFQEFYNMM